MELLEARLVVVELGGGFRERGTPRSGTVGSVGQRKVFNRSDTCFYRIPFFLPLRGSGGGAGLFFGAFLPAGGGGASAALTLRIARIT